MHPQQIATELLQFIHPGPRIPGPIPEPPRFGHGAIVRQPTLAVVGDAGPEAVVPLGAGGGFGSTTNIFIQGDAIIDDDARMGKLADEMSRRQEIINRRGVR